MQCKKGLMNQKGHDKLLAHGSNNQLHELRNHLIMKSVSGQRSEFKFLIFGSLVCADLWQFPNRIIYGRNMRLPTTV